MKIIADTHVHIYPFYDIGRALRSTLDNLARLNPGAMKIACLTERFDCDVYNQLMEEADESIDQQFNIESRESGACLQITCRENNQDFYLLPGQQIITAENLEILGLNMRHRVTEGNSAEQTIDQVLDSGGIPVIAWGFGKWLGKRGDVVNRLVQSYDATQIVIGDTTMRPYGWFAPIPFRKAEKKGIRVLCGSDPLPFAGEEIRPGSYACQWDWNDNNARPSDIMNCFFASDIAIQPVGRRNTAVQVARRMQNHKQAGKIAIPQN